ncbi:hypothetical protein K2173_010315 [Erythroxylum novogranatense]|uniref:Uncharacterized protein n=1 Tax=Erythroxylum novogranatense TaxID=1862640 RepID=A0AAV8TFP1_9ROSI|nr:hypothetical protein K2173_010315 [Erythroxylum novogranatense]
MSQFSCLFSSRISIYSKTLSTSTIQSKDSNNQKMHPAMYDDVTLLTDKLSDKLRCRECLPAMDKPHPCSNCMSGKKPMSPSMTNTEKDFKDQTLVNVDFSATNVKLDQSGDEHFKLHVPLGTGFQAEVPEWIGIPSQSDSKWLGIQVLPLDNGDHMVPLERDPIGKGRPESCHCSYPGSVICVRFHIAEKRMKLKIELGPLFYRWKFDHMGEEVSLRWTDEEELKFKDMVRSNSPSQGKCFWDYAHRYFPKKPRTDLVSYYFNVLLVQRRSYQNRVTPKDIDSDDDESDFGSFSEGFGLEAVRVPSANLLICKENQQYTDFEQIGSLASFPSL